MVKFEYLTPINSFINVREQDGSEISHSSFHLRNVTERYKLKILLELI